MNKFNTEESMEPIAAWDESDLKDAYIDYRKKYYKNTVPDSRVLVFLTGFCIGMVFFYWSRGQNWSGSAAVFLDREHLAQLQNFEVYRSGLFEYVLDLRVRQIVFCVICSLSTIGGLLAYSIMAWYGFEMGLVIFSLVYQYGIKGAFLTCSMILPHGIFYIIIFLLIFNKYWENDKNCCHKMVTENDNGHQKKLENLKKIVLVFVLFLIGILCEIYLNPEIMKKMALFF